MSGNARFWWKRSRTDEQMTDVTNYQLAAIAVALLGGDTEYIDREDIAIKLDDIAPGRFNWRKYPSRIDLVVVVAALRDAKKPKNGQLLVGSNAQGWMLSPDGLQWVKALDLSVAVQDEQIAEHRKESLRANQEAERLRLRATTAYRLFTTGRREEICLQDLHRFSRVNEYFREKAKQRRYAIIDNVTAEDEVLSDLWSYLRERFREEMA
jgi:hypothetical protein